VCGYGATLGSVISGTIEALYLSQLIAMIIMCVGDWIHKILLYGSNFAFSTGTGSGTGLNSILNHTYNNCTGTVIAGLSELENLSSDLMNVLLISFTTGTNHWIYMLYGYNFFSVLILLSVLIIFLKFLLTTGPTGPSTDTGIDTGFNRILNHTYNTCNGIVVVGLSEPLFSSTTGTTNWKQRLHGYNFFPRNVKGRSWHYLNILFFFFF
jgi:hypothetical protein